MTELKPIRTAADHTAALDEIEALMAAGEDADRLELLAVLVADYERRAFEDPPEPADVLEVAMQMQGRSQAELSGVLGSRARASEVLGRRRGLSGEMAHRIAEAWSLPRRLLGGGAETARPRGRAATAALVAVLGLASVGAGVGVEAMRDLPGIAPVERLAAGPGSLATLPPYVYQAVLSAQDGRFFDHAGYDGRAIARAAGSTLTHWSEPSGGATLTQQLVKNVLLKGEARGVRRKVREIVLARQVERALTKEQILDAWLAAVYYGGGATGLNQASVRYFGRPARELTVAQAAYLAAAPNAPERLRLDRADNAERAKAARDAVLRAMARRGYLTPTAARNLAKADLT